VYQPPENAKGASDPHEDKHINAKTSTNIEALLTRDNVPEDHEHDRRNDRRCRGEESRNERPDSEREGPPSRIEHDRREEDTEDVHADPRQEEPEHDVACNLDQIQNVVDVRRESDGSTGKQFIEQDLNGVEPVERLGG